MRVYRLEPKTGAKQYPIQEAGGFILGDPKHGNRKHITANKVTIRTEQEMIDLIMRGFSVRVETKTRASLVRLNLFVDGKKVS
ncbi:hypothetical protein [Rhizobium rhizogenes]|uniref:hypothetical protein n=1 Tax=Rhizobium rhizogenes TaxID=359 RepID=UPI0022C51FD2|nr:hypothetical protein [Rhizobium rhizogenes]MCZ7453509.1 hypothetical protein [Rhizobium rhizogenes]